MISPTTFEGYRDLARRGGIVPVLREFSADTLTPVTAYAAIARPPFGFLLESLVGGERWARYTFLGTEPSEAWRYHKGRVDRWTPTTGWYEAGQCNDPLEHIAERLRPLKGVNVPGLPRFAGGAVGYLGYDVVRAIESLPGGPMNDLDMPEAAFIIADTLVIIDNAFGRAILLANTRVEPGASVGELRKEYDRAIGRIEVLLDRLHEPPRLIPLSLAQAPELPTQSPFSRAEFERDVARIKRHIAAGDVFQAVLSRRQDVSVSADPLNVYRSLRALNPAPYLYFLTLDDFAIAGSSPEVLVRVEESEITVRPIAGTRPRGSDPDHDEHLARELLNDEKELAEHAMLVDLGRNDVGRVAEFGSVKVTEDRVIERYSHVQHIVSEVRGRLRPSLDAVDVLRACFPAGTVTGAPKIRAMQLLDGMEPTQRGPYAGAICHIGWGGVNLDTAITIRTALLRGDKAYVQAGAGIVADSDPSREFEETENKASAVLRALAIAARR
ncbi:MAG: chorismate-binding protein [Gemmatimonadota bacterium]|nr:MAG: chorismate-binding protein [Gemmatimonadota bacterium]